MLVIGARNRLFAGAALLLVAAASSAQADAKGSIAAAVGLTAADGSVRTQAGVRLSISAPAGAPDRVRALSGPVQARMGELRECFAQAMLRTPTTEGRAEYELEVGHRAKVRTVRDETGDPQLVACMKAALGRTAVSGVPRGSRALVGLALSNPLAGMKRRIERAAPEAEIEMLAGGLAASEGGTQAGEVRFRVTGSAYATPTIASVQRDLSAQLAGLLDCRRKAFRRDRDARGRVEVALKVRSGALAPGRPRSTLKQGAPQCVARLLTRVDAAHLADADLEVAINFAP